MDIVKSNWTWLDVKELKYFREKQIGLNLSAKITRFLSIMFWKMQKTRLCVWSTQQQFNFG